MSETKVISRTYAATDMCARPANETGFWDPGYTYDVLLTKLTPNTRYYYSYGSGEVCSALLYSFYYSVHFLFILFLLLITTSLVILNSPGQ